MKKSLLIPMIIFTLSMWLFLATHCAVAENQPKLSTKDAAQLDATIETLRGKIAENDQDFESFKQLGIVYHMKAVANAKTYAPLAVDALTRARELDKRDTEVLCYLGSATTMLAKTTFNPVKKMGFVNKGTGYMDKAVSQSPDNVTVRLTRAQNAMRLPAFLNRQSFALIDLEHLSKMIDKNPEQYASIKQGVYADLSKLYDKNGDPEKAALYRQKAAGQ